MSFIILWSLFTPSGLFSYHTSSDSSAPFRFGYWKKASQLTFLLEIYFFRHDNPSRLGSLEVWYIRPNFCELCTSTIPPGWFLVTSSTLGTLRKDDENADVSPRGLGQDVAVVVDVVGQFFLTVRNAKNSGNSIISSSLQVLEP